MLPFSTLGPAASFASSVLEQFKPSRAPYLLAVSIGALFIIVTLDDKLPNEKKMLVIFPIFAFTIVLSVLAFFFKPFEAADVEGNPDAVAADIDTQFKLARTTGLIIGISCLYVVAYRRSSIDVFYVILWSIIMFHCLVYIIYIMFRNIREESTQNKSFFQISFMTSLFLFLLAFGGSKIQDNDRYSVFYGSCVQHIEFIATTKAAGPFEKGVNYKWDNNLCLEDEADMKRAVAEKYNNVLITSFQTPVKTISLDFITFVFFTIMWSAYIFFWIIQIMRIWGKSQFIISD